MKVFDFVCENGHDFEAFVKNENSKVFCPECGASAYRVVSASKFRLEGWSGAFPSKASKWEREHEEAGKRGRERKKEQAFYTPPDKNSLF